MSITLNIHPQRNYEFSAETKVFHEGEAVEFHTLTICPDGDTNISIFFHNKEAMVAALNDLRLTCEAKIWELQGIPEAYDLDAEPF